jgi:hypothetical protein
MNTSDGPGPSVAAEQPGESEKVKRFAEDCKPPEFIDSALQGLERLRQFVHTDSMRVKGDKDALAVNYVLNGIYTKLNQIFPDDPQCRIKQRRLIGTNLALRQMLQQAADTAETLTQRLFDDANGAKVAQGAAQDAFTTGFQWVVVHWIEEYERDPLGARQVVDDSTEQMVRLRFLMEQHEAGEFDEDSEEWKDLLDLTQYAAEQARGQLQDEVANADDDRFTRLMEIGTTPEGQPLPMHLKPEVDRWQGVSIENYDPEDVRWDWSIKRPEDWRRAEWWAYRVWLHPEEILEKFGAWLTPEQRDAVGKPTKGEAEGDKHDADPRNNEVDDDKRGGTRAVWTRWDRKQHRVYVWIDGEDWFLRDFTPEITWPGFFPCSLVYFNRVTGRFMPVSDVELVEHLQKEANNLMTERRDARRASYPWYAARKGAIKPHVKRQIRLRRPYDVIDVDSTDDIREALQENLGGHYKPELYDNAEIMRGFEVNMNLPAAAFSAEGQAAQFAKEVEVNDKHASNQAGRHASQLNGCFSEVFQLIFYYAAAAMPESTVQRLVGEGAVWPQWDREGLFRYLSVTVEAGGTNKPGAQDEMDMFTNFGAFAKDLGFMPNPKPVLERIMGTLGIHEPVDEFMRPIGPLLGAGIPTNTAPVAAPAQAQQF